LPSMEGRRKRHIGGVSRPAGAELTRPLDEPMLR
jgi:hypothetical protein